MKTTKKGFTLIELIVVIAIIGVLAAILVPSMLGYVKKSKIQGANSTAATLAKAADSAVTDLDAEDKLIADATIVKGSDCSPAAATVNEIADAIEPFFKEFKGNADMMVEFKDGVCVAAAVQSGNYYGTFPAIYTAKNWDKEKPADTTAALSAAYTKATT